MKRILTALAAFALAFMLVPAVNAEADESDFVIENGVLIEYNGTDTHVVIPDGVTWIGVRAFEYNASIISVIIPNSVTSIDYFAFGRCINLESIVIPDSVTSISSYAFQGCTSLMNITISDSVEYIGENAFFGCVNLTDIIFKSAKPPAVDNRFEFFPGNLTLTNVYVPRGSESEYEAVIYRLIGRRAYNIVEINKHPDTGVAGITPVAALAVVAFMSAALNKRKGT
ncbi:MAG: leucine-rich repeat domain-containing protein [Oscillospiraceae bacterium]|nr:leucine-rich repeat domain-containing protein [Oscillospiraceae bacterium]